MTAFDKAWSILKYYQTSEGYETIIDPYTQRLLPLVRNPNLGEFQRRGIENLPPVNLPGPKTLNEFISDARNDQSYIKELERLLGPNFNRMQTAVDPELSEQSK